MEESTKEQPIAVTTSSVARKAYYKFYWYWAAHHRVSFIVYLVLLVLLLALTIWLAFIRDKTAMIIPMLWLLMFYLPKRYFDKHHEMYEAETVHAFYEGHLRSRCTVAGTIHYRATPYTTFKAAVETKSSFYLTLGTRKPQSINWADYYDPDPYGASVILDKQCLSEEQVQSLRELFGRAFGERFRVF